MESRGHGISGVLAALVAMGALLVGLAAGVALGGAGGFVLGQRAGRGAGDLLGQRATRAPVDAVRPDARSDRGAPTPGGAPEAQAAPVPGMPDIRILGAGGAYLGVEVTAPEAASDGAPAATGALVRTVVPGSAAEKAGLQVGDVIVAVDDRAIAAPDDLAAAIAAREPGDAVTVTVERDGQEASFEATLGAHAAVAPLDPSSPSLDDLLQQLPPELRDRFREIRPSPTDESGA